MHLERRNVNEEARPDESVMHPMIAQHMAHILAKKTFNAFPKLLHAIDVLLRHPPGAIGGIRRPRFEGPDLFLDLKIPGDVRDQVLQEWKSFNRLDRDRLIEREIVQPRHAHEFWHAVDFRRAGTAFT